MSKCILEFIEPIAKIESEMKTLSDIRRSKNIYALIPPKSGETPEEKMNREQDNDDRKDMVKTIYNQHVKTITERTQICEQNMTVLWSDIIGNCSPSLQEEISGDPLYTSKSSSFDSVWLLQTLQKITAGANKTTNKYYSIFKSLKSFYNTQQGFNEPLDSYYQRFESARDLVELFDGSIADMSTMLAQEQAITPNTTDNDVMQKFLAMSLILNSNKRKYEGLWNKLENDLLVGQDTFPTNIGAATHLLTNWKSDSQPTSNENTRDNSHNGNANGGGHHSNVQFAQIPIPSNNDFSNLPGFDSARPTLVPSRKPPHHLSAHITCTRCNHPGHYASSCPFLLTGRPQLFQHPSLNRIFQLTNLVSVDPMYDPGCIIVDSGSSFNSVRDISLLVNPTSCPPFESFSNGGGLTYTTHGTMTLFPDLTAYQHDQCLVNIVSLDLLQAKYHVFFDSAVANSFSVVISEDNILHFQGMGSGLYIHKVNTVTPYSFINTVTENKSFYTNQEVKDAEAAREQQAQIGWPSDQEYHEIVRDNKINNSKCTIDDIQRAKHIYGGMAVELIKGKSTYKAINTSANIQRIPLPPIVLQTHPSEDLDLDFLYVQGAPYLFIKSVSIKFQAILAFNKINRITKRNQRKVTYKRSPSDIINGIEKVLRLLNHRGFKTPIINADNEFSKLEGKISTHIEICGAGQHIPRIERGIRTIKDRTRCFWVSLPFKKVPKLMVDECLTMVITCLNDFPQNNGISDTLSPGSIVLGRGKVDGNNLRATFGRYYEVFSGTDNTNKERRISAICLRPSNSQGGYYFMNIETGKRIHGYNFTELAMPDYILDRVHVLAEQEHAPDLDTDGCPIFEWELGVPFGVDDATIPPDQPSDDDLSFDNASYHPESDDDDDSDDDLLSDDFPSSDDASISDPDSASSTPHAKEARSDDDNDPLNNPSSDASSVSSSSSSSSSSPLRSTSNKDTAQSRNTQDKARSEADDEQQKVRSEDECYDDTDDTSDQLRRAIEEVRSEIDPNNIMQSKRIRKQNKEPNIGSFGGKKYHPDFLNLNNKAFSHFEKGSQSTHERQQRNLFRRTVGICFNQMTAKRGIKLYGEKAIAAMFKEYKQLDDLEVLGRIDPDSLTQDQKRKALRAVNLIKIKRCGKVKGRTCADGSVQRNYVPREEASSPTLSNEALMCLLLINSFEGRDIAVFDVPGAYLHADIPESKFVILKIEDDFVDIMCDVNPEYLDDVRYEGKKKVLYVKILKALYGMIESALLWHSLYTEVLEKEGFELNPYDRCVANKTINGKQCTLAWYVDDNILSHNDPKVVDQVLETIESYFPGLVIERGRKLNYLGMELDFFEKGRMKLGTVQYLKGMITELEEELSEFNENLDRQYVSPAAKRLFTVDETSPPVHNKKADIYRKYVAKTIWVEKRSRPDIEPSVSFLSKRVKQPTKDDWHKFKRLMCFVKSTVEDVRVIGADNLLEMLVMIDSAHAVHNNLRGHTGGITTFGTGVIDQKSSMQKMNTRSLTETEHVGTSEYLPKPIFFKLFMNAQGYEPKMTLAKDNESEIRMLNNGQASCTSNSKHVAIKFFWCTDRIKNGNIKVKYCPTEKMVADYMSKPLQGSLYKQFRKVIMGWQHISTLYKPPPLIEERVENNKKSEPNLAINNEGHKTCKMTYSQVLKCRENVRDQNEMIRMGFHPSENIQLPVSTTH